MNIRNLLLGSLAVAGLSTTGAFAADLGVLTSLDVCDNLGLSGLTISSDTNCLQITGGVSYTFSWGDYRTAANYDQIPGNPWADADDGNNDFMVPGESATGTGGGPAGTDFLADGGSESTDWESNISAWLKVVASQESDFGTAKAVVTLRQVSRYRTQDAGWHETDSAANGDSDGTDPGFWGQGINNDSTNGIELQDAYVQIGDSTVITAGLRRDGKDGSIVNIDDDTPFNYVGLFGSTATASGVLFKDGAPVFGGASVQVESDLGNGLKVAVGLENIDNTDGHSWDPVNNTNLIEGSHYTGDAVMNAGYAGTLLGTISYAGDGLSAHVSAGAIGVLDGEIDSWFLHAGATATIDNFKIRGALAYLSDDTLGFDLEALHALVSGQATFDIFTIALSAEYKSTDANAGYGPTKTGDGFGVGGSISAALTDEVAVNLGARWFDYDSDAVDNPLTLGVDESDVDGQAWQVEAQIVAAVTESIKLTGAVGIYGGDTLERSLDDTTTFTPDLSGDETAYYGSLGLAWAPGGGYTSSVVGAVNSEGAYKTTFTAGKTFE